MPYPDPFPVPYSGPVTAGLYPLPKHNVVVLSCMDLRMKDELVSFLDRDNLTNRYDHLITAGAALGVTVHDDLPRNVYHPYTVPPEGNEKAMAAADERHQACVKCHPWRTTFFDHLDVALQLHQPHDVYIVEHRNCGAYREFLNGGVEYKDTRADQTREHDDHARHAFILEGEIHEWYQNEWYPTWYRKLSDEEKMKQDEKLKKGTAKYPAKLHVHCFLMDLRGNVELLHPPKATKVNTRKKSPA